MNDTEEKLTAPKVVGTVLECFLMPFEIILAFAWAVLVFLWGVFECITVCAAENIFRCTPKWVQKRWPCANRREFDATKYKWCAKSEDLDKVTVFYRYADGVYLEKEYPRSMETADMVSDMTKSIEGLAAQKSER